MIRTLILPTLVCLLVSVSPVAADPIEYTDLTSWTAAVTDPTTVNFGNLADAEFWETALMTASAFPIPTTSSSHGDRI